MKKRNFKRGLFSAPAFMRPKVGLFWLEGSSFLPRKRQRNYGPVFSINFFKFSESLTGILRKYWDAILPDPVLSNLFPSPPIVAYRSQPHLRSKLSRDLVQSEYCREVPLTPREDFALVSRLPTECASSSHKEPMFSWRETLVSLLIPI